MEGNAAGDGLYLGTDVRGQMEEWWWQEYVPGFRARHGQGAGIAVLLFHQSVRWDMLRPNLHIAVRLTTDIQRATQHQGWNANILGKWMVLGYTGAQRSSYIVDHPELVEAGMFPHDGAGWIRGIPAGASGLPTGPEDFDEACLVVDRYIQLRTAAAELALAASADRSAPGRPMKYLADMTWRPPAAATNWWEQGGPGGS